MVPVLMQSTVIVFVRFNDRIRGWVDDASFGDGANAIPVGLLRL